MSTLFLYFNGSIKKDENYTYGRNFHSIGISEVKGQIYTSDFSIDDTLPEYILKYLKKISFRDKFSDVAHRKTGIYKFHQTVARLDKKVMYEIEITGTNLVDIRDLYGYIRRGIILPFESWEETQLTEVGN